MVKGGTEVVAAGKQCGEKIVASNVECDRMPDSVARW